jgi:ferredoxin--NADP+ reductase
VNPIIEKQDLSENVVRMVLAAPDIARKRRAGQFVILKMDEKGERIPLTIVDSDERAGTLTIIFQVVGKSTAALAAMKAGEALTDLQGPLGNPTEIENFGHVVCIGGGGCRLPAGGRAQEGGEQRHLDHRCAKQTAAHP